LEKEESRQQAQTEKKETESKADTEQTCPTGGEQAVSQQEKADGTSQAVDGTEEQTEPQEKKEDGAVSQEVEELQKKLEEANRQLEKQKDLLLRTAAEYDNYRKRTAREKDALYGEATASAVLEILTVVDSLERALEQKECSAEDMRKGVELVYRQMQSALDKLGVQEMGREGDTFDPALHNAISHVEDENSGENVIVKVFQKGYKIGDRVIRHAMVQVAN
jgi:molecular chaperone GrpE